MATELKILDRSYEAAEDLSNDKYRFVVLDPTTNKVRRPDSATEVPRGILQNAPVAGEAAVVRELGVSKMQANAALAIGTAVKPEYVSAADAGKGQDAAGELQCARGIVIEASGAEDDIASVMLIDVNPTRQTVAIPLSDLTANSTVRQGLLAVTRAVKVTKLSIAAYNQPSDADGAMTLAIQNYDASAAADDNLLVAATFNLETLTAKTSEALALTATAADLVLAAGDFIYAELVNDSAAINTNLGGAVVVIEFDLL